MRKILIILFLLISLNLFAQRSIEDINGYDWYLWDDTTKQYYVIGYLSAYSSMFLRLIQQSEIPENQIKEAEDIFIFRTTISRLVALIDNFYSSPDNRKRPLYLVILYVSGKAWWE